MTDNNADVNSYRTIYYSGRIISQLTGDESLVSGAASLPFTVKDFWQWAYSDILTNIQRGTLAEYIVKSALEFGGCYANQDTRSSFEPFDLIGPSIKISAPHEIKVPCRIEVKSAAYVQAWAVRHPEKEVRPIFSIAPSKVPDEKGDYAENAPRQRNSDLYVFTLYTGKTWDDNILDVALWEFYVVPTFILNDKFKEQKTLSLKKLHEICPGRCTFETLYAEILHACDTISSHS